MRLREIENRIKELRNAIAYSRNEQKIMTIGEGICCNLEIASWFRVMDGQSSQPKYTVSEIVNDKVLDINDCIIEENWIKPEII
ncbi:hypothetical protein [uncultured Tenacibaculum sp.]|uniref:hypothetical protein n=1 Tax=Tenacibaculum sp. ZS6-P6 TaxID=3447503 RepID=UPI002604AD09|nr:hypothetical protein [uncultured Tenacibaculum sp.]